MEIHPIRHPLKFIDSYCESLLTSGLGAESGTIHSCVSNDFNLGNVYQQLLKENPQYFSEIPCMTSITRPKNGSLVRYRCLVQDIKNPEYYIGIGRRTHGYSVCKYRDHLEDDEDFDDMDQIYFERQPIIGITIPGELSLDFPSETLQCLIHIYDPIPKSHLRLHDMIEVVGIVESTSLESVPPYEEERNYPITSNDLPVDQPKKKQKVESNDLSFEEEELLSMVSSYQNTSTSYSHVFTISHQQYLRIHCLFYYPISPSFPFYSSLCDPNTLLEYDIACSNEASSIVQSFTSILQDSLVSQYLTLALISSVYNRVDSGKSVGNLPLNIWNTNSISSDTFQQLISFIRKIVPRTYVLTLDQDNLETTTFGLSKDDQRNILNSSPFQLGQNTVILIYEKSLAEPQKDFSNTSKNLEIFRNLIFHQKLQIDFNYYHIDLPVNYPVIIFSDQPSFFASEKVISIKYQPTQLPQLPPSMEDISIDPIPKQLWWSKCLEINSAISTNPSLIQRIEDDYVNSRQDQDSLRSLSTPDDLHIALALTRLYAVSGHSKEINLSHWEYILYLEEARSMR